MVISFLIVESIDLGFNMNSEMAIDSIAEHSTEPVDPTDPMIRYSILSKIKHKNTPSILVHLDQDLKSMSNMEQIVKAQNFGKAFKTPRGRRLVIESNLKSSESTNVFLCKDVIGANLTVLKLQKPAQFWEYYIYTKLAKTNLAVKVVSFSGFKDASILELEYLPSQTILSSFMNNNEITDQMAYIFALKLVKLVSQFHQQGFIHGDICPENIIMDDINGWKLIDFGACIDLASFPNNQMFKMEPMDDTLYECFEMQNGLEWKFEPDWFAVALVCHQLLFKNEEFKILNKSELKRPIQTIAAECDEKWRNLFDILLNADSEAKVNAFLTQIE